jgi:hypothetical protein
MNRQTDVLPYAHMNRQTDVLPYAQMNRQTNSLFRFCLIRLAFSRNLNCDVLAVNNVIHPFALFSNQIDALTFDMATLGIITLSIKTLIKTILNIVDLNAQHN